MLRLCSDWCGRLLLRVGVEDVWASDTLPGVVLMMPWPMQAPQCVGSRGLSLSPMNMQLGIMTLGHRPALQAWASLGSDD